MATGRSMLNKISQFTLSDADQAAFGTRATLDRAVIAASVLPEFTPQGVLTDATAKTGVSGPTYLERVFQTVGLPLSIEKPNLNDLLSLLYRAMGAVAVTVNGDGSFLHKITERVLTEDEPILISAGTKIADIQKYIFKDVFVDSLNLGFNESGFLRCDCQLMGSGDHLDNTIVEIVSADGDATTFDLVDDDLYGSDIASWTASIHFIQFDVDGDGSYRVFLDNVAATDLDTVTFTSPGEAATPFNYRIVYRSKAQEAAWGSEVEVDVPDSEDRQPVQQPLTAMSFGGSWNNGTNVWTGGRDINCEFREWSLDIAQNGIIKQCPLGTGEYGHQILRNPHTINFNLSRRLIDLLIWQYAMDIDNGSFFWHWQDTTAIAGGANYPFLKMVIPKMVTPQQVHQEDGNYHAEQAGFTLLSDPDINSRVIFLIQSDINITA